VSRELMHYGILRKSGRYPWGSGKDEYQRSMDFYAYVNKLKDAGFAPKEIAQAIGLAAPDDRGFSIADLRDTTTIAKEQVILEQTRRVAALKAKGMSPAAIAAETGLTPGTIRNRLKNSEERNESSLRKTAEILRENVDKYDIVDIGKGVGLQMGLSPERLRAAASVLRDEGYETYTLQTRNVGTRHMTHQQVMVKPGTGYGNAKRMTDRIHTMGEWTEDNGLTFFGIHPPLSISSKRVGFKYKEDGGHLQDGVIYIRPDVPDISMGKNTYSQVRILVDGNKYIKGMALYSKDMPDGVDLLVHTPKSKADGPDKVLRPSR
jgi:lambda repressor-like predicted transcriptional regulator